MTDQSVATVSAACLLFGGQLVTMLQNVFLAKKADSIHDLADGNLSAIRADLEAANGKLEAQNAKVASLEALVGTLANTKGEPGPRGEPGETGQQGRPGTAYQKR